LARKMVIDHLIANAGDREFIVLLERLKVAPHVIKLLPMSF
jgi:hypothetical protein